MQRIAIMGPCGSGKSTLAQKISEITGLPLIHLDKEFHLPNWVERGDDEWQNIHASLIAKENWIIDGNYSGNVSSRLKRADLVIIFDLPTWLCLYRVVKRVTIGYGKERADSAIDCKERFNLEFLLYVFNFRRTILPKTLKIIEQRPNNTELITVKSNKDIQKIYQRFEIISKQGANIKQGKSINAKT
jgi:adenylate kinase family enzyme